MMQFKMNQTAEQSDWRSFTPEQLNEMANDIDQEKAQTHPPRLEPEHGTPPRKEKQSPRRAKQSKKTASDIDVP